MSADEYAANARWYNAVTAGPLHALRQRIAALCAEQGWRTVLDYGCGTGEQLYALRLRGLEATGFDASPAMLAVARRGHPDLSLVLGASPAPFADGSFDAVLLTLVLHETTAGAGTVLRDALRLAPRALVLEWRMPERNLDYPGQVLTHMIERVAGQGHYRRFRHFAAQGWLRGLARQEGCSIVRERRELYGLFTVALCEPGEGETFYNILQDSKM